MPNNIIPGGNIVIASATISFVEAGLTADNTIDLYRYNSGNPVSWRPDKEINTLPTAEGLIEGLKYILSAKIAFDATAVFSDTSNNIIPMTQAEYDALEVKDPNVYYDITDATEL